MAWVELIGSIIFSWPVVALVIALLFREPLLALFRRFGDGVVSEAEFGPLKIKLGALAQEGESAVKRLNRITELMAKSRLLELEITSGMFGTVIAPEQHSRMQEHIGELRKLTSDENF